MPALNFLLLRGLTREARHWAGFEKTLEARVPGAKAHCLDTPGTGTECRRQSPWSIREIADDLRVRWLPLRSSHEGPWLFVALSMGGMVAMDWCSRHAADFAGLVLMSSSAGDLSHPLKRFKWRNIPVIFRQALSRNALEKEARVLAMTSNLRAGDRAVAVEWSRLAEECPISAETGLRQLVASARFRAPARLDLPVLVLASRRDCLTDHSCSTALSRRFGAPIELHEAAGHDLTLDDPDWVCQKIQAWLQAPGIELTPPRAPR